MKNQKEASILLIKLSLGSVITSYLPLPSLSRGKFPMVHYSRTTFQPLDDEATTSQVERDIAKGVNSTGGGTNGQQGVDLGYLNASYLNYSYLEPVYFDPFTGKIRAEQFSAKS